MPQSYTFLKDKDNVIQSNFVKTKNDNDINNNTDTEPNTRHSTSVSKPTVAD